VADFFFDESKHPNRGNFIVGAFVGAHEDIAPDVEVALQAEGLTPGVHEFKSSANMREQPEQARLRERLRAVLGTKGRIALVVLPHGALGSLGEEALGALGALLRKNNWPESTRHRAFFDQQVFSSKAAAERAIRAAGLPESVELHVEQDSRVVPGLQLADLAAHTCATMLLEQMGLVKKTVKAGENSGYDPDLDINLGFELWAATRWNYFSGPMPCVDDMESLMDFKVQVSGYGLFVSSKCPQVLRDAAEARFGEMYLGCIH
jgi:hypothetical protein